MAIQQLVSQKQPTSSFKLVIPADVEKIIRHLCNTINTIEWSGILFYTHEGSWETKDLTVTCVDILPMDIGSAGYTEFNMNADVISYMTEHDLLDCDCGLIHSHNKMSAFFSGTDVNTLEKEGQDRNHFVSLIVNNAGQYVAAITRNVQIHETVTSKSEYYTFDNVKVELEGTKEEERVVNKVQYKMMEVIKDEVSSPFQEIDERLNEIRKSKEEAKKPVNNFYNFNKNNTRQLSFFDEVPERASLWDGYEDRWWNNKDFSSGIDIPEDFVKLTAARIMLSSMSITNIHLFDFDKWAKKLDTLFDKIFERDDSRRYWLEMMCEYVVFDTAPEALCKKYESTPEEIGNVLIEKLLMFFDTLPESKHLNLIISILNGMVYE